MTEDQFWHGDIKLLEVYQKAYYRNIKYTKWIEGQYMMAALNASCIGNSSYFHSKSTPPNKYPEDYDDPFKEHLKEEDIDKEEMKKQNNIIMASINEKIMKAKQQK